MTTEPERSATGGNRPGERNRSVESGSTSIDVFQRNESLAGFITDTADLDDEEFLEANPFPVLLTSMPDEIALAVWTVILPVKKKAPQGVSEKTLLRMAQDLYVSDGGTRPNRYFMGRAPECDIVLAPRSISKKHAVLDSRDGRWFLTDLGSTNGTRVNGRPLTPKTPVVLAGAPSKIEFGSDTIVWFVPPAAFLDYIKTLKRQVPDTPQGGVPYASSLVSTPKDPIKLPSKPPSKLESTKTSLTRIKPDFSEAETHPLIREESSLSNICGDEDAIPLPKPEKSKSGRVVPPVDPPVGPPPSLQMGLQLKQEPIDDPYTDPKLMAAIRALAAMDSLILAVTARLKSDPKTVSIATADEGTRTDEIADQLVRLGPMLKTVWVTLTVGNGKPIEIYSIDSGRLSRMSENS